MGSPVLGVGEALDEPFLLQPVHDASHGGAVDLASRRQFSLGETVFEPEKGEKAELLGGEVVTVELLLEEGACPLIGLGQQETDAFLDFNHDAFSWK
jgi:hypothetical protein